MIFKKINGYAYKLWRRLRRFVSEKYLTETYFLTRLEDYGKQHSLKVTKIASATLEQGVPPVFFRDDDLCAIDGYDGCAPSPDINIFEFDKVMVVGRTEFILKDRLALYPGVIDPKADAFMMELENRGSVDVATGGLRLFPRSAVVRCSRAISLLGQCNGNYAHWVTEVLARFVLIDEMPEFRGVPLLVDHPVHEKLLDALDFLNVSRREIIQILPYQKVQVDHLIYISPPSMTPPETRCFFESGMLAPPRVEQFHFSRFALGRLRDRTVKMAQDCRPSPKGELFWDEDPAPANRRIFLRRQAWSTGNGRLLRNADVVEQYLEELGFAGHEIADYSFEGQVLTAREAGIIVSPIGAALTNLVFRDPGCIVIILTPHYANATYYYFANLMAALGHQTIFVLGPQTRHGGQNIYNRDFRISMRLLRQAVRKAIEIEHGRKVRIN